MIVTVNSQILAQELRAMNRIVPTKPAIAILSHVKLTGSEGSLVLSATDIEVALTSSCPARVEGSGDLALPVAKLLALVEQFSDGDVTIAPDKVHVLVKCGAFQSRLSCLPAADFPQLPDVTGPAHQFDADAFRRLISRVRYAINAASSKYILQGALLTAQGTGMAMVATDGKRLALATAGRSGEEALNVVIPAKALDVLSGQAEMGTVEMTVGEKHLHFACGGRLLTTRVVDGQFPAYQRIIPTSNDKEVRVNRLSLIAALKRITLVSDVNLAVYLTLGGGRLELASQSAEVGSASEVVQNVDYEGDPMKICINGDFALDFLQVSTGQMTLMKLRDANTAMLMMDGEDHVGVVMLMR